MFDQNICLKVHFSHDINSKLQILGLKSSIVSPTGHNQGSQLTRLCTQRWTHSLYTSGASRGEVGLGGLYGSIYPCGKCNYTENLRRKPNKFLYPPIRSIPTLLSSPLITSHLIIFIYTIYFYFSFVDHEGSDCADCLWPPHSSPYTRLHTKLYDINEDKNNTHFKVLINIREIRNHRNFRR